MKYGGLRCFHKRKNERQNIWIILRLEGSLGENNYGCFYRFEELEEVNDEYEVQTNWPGYVVIGSDMSGQLWAYNPEKEIYCQIDSENTDDDTYYTKSKSFEEFLNKMDEELA